MSVVLYGLISTHGTDEMRMNSKIKQIFTNFAISRRGPILCNTVLDATLKEIESLPLFKEKVKEMLLLRDNELSFF